MKKATERWLWNLEPYFFYSVAGEVSGCAPRYTLTPEEEPKLLAASKSLG